MKFIGAHVSTSGGIQNAPIHAHAIGASAFSLFIKNQRQWHAKPLENKIIHAFQTYCKELDFTPDQILPHASYLINLGHPDKTGLTKSREAFLDEMQRCELLGLKRLNIHPGSHLNKYPETYCLKTIAESINITLSKTNSVSAVLENTAGQGSNLGYTFEQINNIIQLVEEKSRIGVCIDTCHAFTAGYELSTYDGFSKTFEHFEETIGFQYLQGLHLNDSKKKFQTRVDRHASLGEGFIGKETFQRIMQDARFDNIPLILETPDETIWAKEINWLQSLASNKF